MRKLYLLETLQSFIYKMIITQLEESSIKASVFLICSLP